MSGPESPEIVPIPHMKEHGAEKEGYQIEQGFDGEAFNQEFGAPDPADYLSGLHSGAVEKLEQQKNPMDYESMGLPPIPDVDPNRNIERQRNMDLAARQQRFARGEEGFSGASNSHMTNGKMDELRNRVEAIHGSTPTETTTTTPESMITSEREPTTTTELPSAKIYTTIPKGQ